ncbi:hypothetical protein G6F57_023039 [Rhizopus arrhizus]|nr:hypothetical protein G6F57_023039 [Rhizopus arrhizus]
MPEQFSVGKRAADGAAVHGDKRLAAPFAGVVDRARNNLFARAALSHDENAGIGGRRQLQLGAQFLHDRRQAGYVHRKGRGYDRVLATSGDAICHAYTSARREPIAL